MNQPIVVTINVDAHLVRAIVGDMPFIFFEDRYPQHTTCVWLARATSVHGTNNWEQLRAQCFRIEHKFDEIANALNAINLVEEKA